MALTVVSGLVDAVCYLGLGRVFTANMTGNLVVLGFAAAGAAGFSVTATLTSLALFVAAAALIAFLQPTVATGCPRYVVIAVLAFPMGVRNATVRRLAVPDLTTTVLTMTLTGLAADAAAPGGEHGAAVYRRVAAVLAMLIGATAGAAAFLHKGPALPLLVAALVVAVTGWPSG